MPLKVLDLFAGIGGFSLGLERAGFETVAFCECEPFCQKVLAKHWPGVPIYDDVRELTAERLAGDGIAVDVITGGFPCQDISVCGRRTGLEGKHSGLWVELARIIGELRPGYVIVENSPSLCVRGLGDILGDLAELGYDAEWHGISAASVGAPHYRARQWVVAYPCSKRHNTQKNPICTGWPSSESGAWWESEPAVCRVANGVSGQVDRLRALGNAVVPQIPELIGRAIMEAERAA